MVDGITVTAIWPDIDFSSTKTSRQNAEFFAQKLGFSVNFCLLGAGGVAICKISSNNQGARR
ncbi:hypothetical protein NSTC745_05055 [Nostoc sp. DSM 114161]|jgi:hypothetical protein